LHGRDAPGGIARADIDIWIVGNLSAQEAAAKVVHIGEVLSKNARDRGRTVGCCRSRNTITFFSAYPFRPVQVILALFRDAQDVLLGFDLDAPCLAMDGAQLWTAPRALRAITTGVNTLRADVLSLNIRGSKRLLKCAF